MDQRTDGRTKPLIELFFATKTVLQCLPGWLKPFFLVAESNPIRSFVCLSYLSDHPSNRLSILPSVHPSVHPFVHLPVRPSVRRFVGHAFLQKREFNEIQGNLGKFKIATFCTYRPGDGHVLRTNRRVCILFEMPISTSQRGERKGERKRERVLKYLRLHPNLTTEQRYQTTEDANSDPTTVYNQTTVDKLQ